MKVTEIIVSAGRTFNHPFEQYSNLRPQVTLKATVDDGEDSTACVKELQRKAEGMVEDHKRNLLESLDAIERMQRRDREIARLESVIKTSQEALETVRTDPIGKMPAAILFDHDRCEYCGEPTDNGKDHEHVDADPEAPL